MLVNAIKLGDQPIQPFLTRETVRHEPRTLSVVVDMSCDNLNPLNPLPVRVVASRFGIELFYYSSSSSFFPVFMAVSVTACFISFLVFLQNFLFILFEVNTS